MVKKFEVGKFVRSFSIAVPGYIIKYKVYRFLVTTKKFQYCQKFLQQLLKCFRIETVFIFAMIPGTAVKKF